VPSYWAVAGAIGAKATAAPAVSAAATLEIRFARRNGVVNVENTPASMAQGLS
jgi:hypothetical protein